MQQQQTKCLLNDYRHTSKHMKQVGCPTQRDLLSPNDLAEVFFDVTPVNGHAWLCSWHFSEVIQSGLT